MGDCPGLAERPPSFIEMAMGRHGMRPLLEVVRAKDDVVMPRRVVCRERIEGGERDSDPDSREEKQTSRGCAQPPNPVL